MYSSTDIAALLVSRGFRVWPIKKGTKTPARSGFSAAEGEVTFHPDDFGDCDVAVLTGPSEGLGHVVCVDLDEGEWPEWLTRGQTLTGKGGRHRWYIDPTGEVRQKVRWLPGIDVKAALGAYAVVSRDGRLLFDDYGAELAPLPEGPVAWPRRQETETHEEWAPPTNKRTPSKRMRDSFFARLLDTDGKRNDLAGALGGTLASWGHDNDEIAGFIKSGLGRHYPASETAKHTSDAIRAADYRREGRPAPGIPSLVELGVEVDEDVHRPPPGELGGETLNAATLACMVLPPVAWLVERYGVCPGAPTIVAGHAGAGKTYMLQDLALAVATPKRDWLGASVRHGRVLHIDHEQGLRETVGRYQDLGLTEEAQLDVCVMPLWRLSLDERGETIRKLAQDRALILIDSLRASLPGVDENESGVRAWLDTLTAVSADTGCVFCLIHHARKGSGDDRGSLDVVRGSSGIVDAAGTVLTLTVPSYEDGEPRPSPILRLAKARTWSPRLDWTPQVVKLGRESDGSTALTGEDVLSGVAAVRAEAVEVLEQLGGIKVANMTRTDIANNWLTKGNRQTRLRVLVEVLDELGLETKQSKQ